MLLSSGGHGYALRVVITADEPPLVFILNVAVAESAPALHHALTRRPVRWLGVGVIGGLLVAWYVVLSRGGWAFDDNLSLELAHSEPFGKYVNSDLFGHWGIGYRLAFWAINAVMPVDYRWIIAALLVLLGASALLLMRIIEMLVGGRWTAILAAGYLTISVLLIRSLEWPSTGLQTIPTILFDLLCLWAYLHYQRQPRARWVGISAGSIAVGLLFYEKPVLMPLFVLVLRVFVLSDDLSPRGIARGLWRERAMWGAYIAVLVAYAVAREAAGASSVASAGAPTASQWADMYWLMWAKSIVPATFGLALPTSSVNSWQLAVGIGLQALIAIALAISIRRRRTAWRAWAALGVCIVALGVVVGIGRLGALGPGAATDQRYLVELAWLIPVFVCLAFSSRRPLGDVSWSESTRRGLRAASRHRLALVALASAAYAGASVATAGHWEDGWGGVPARAWETKVEAGLIAVSRLKSRPVIADGTAPNFVVQPSFVPYSFLSLVLPMYGPAPRFAGPVEGPLYTVAPDGTIAPARVARVIAPPRPVARCGRSTAGDLRIQERIEAPAVGAGSYYLLISYRTSGRAMIPLFLDSGSGFAGAPNDLVRVEPAARQSLAWLGEGSPHGLLLSARSLDYVCVRSTEVISLASTS